MKNYHVYLTALFMLFSLNACNSDDDDTSAESTVKARIKTYSVLGEGWADVYQYTYNEKNQVTKVYREEAKFWNFTYDGNTVTVKNAENANAFVLTLGSNGYVSSMVDEWGDIRTYSYDSKGHMTQIKKGETVKSNIQIKDDCIVSWSKWKDDTEVFKNHTYSGVKNVGKIFNIISEATDPSQWMYYTGLFGIPSAYLCESSQWDYSDTGSTYTYDFDKNGYVTAEHKLYGEDLEEFAYSWEEYE